MSKWIFNQFFVLASVLLIQKIDASVKVVDLSVLKESEMNETNETEWNATAKVGISSIDNIFTDKDQYLMNTSNDSISNVDVQLLQTVYETYYKVALVIVSLTFGIILDLSKVGTVLKTPIGPLISGFCNFIFSPLVRLDVENLVSSDKYLYNNE